MVEQSHCSGGEKVGGVSGWWPGSGGVRARYRVRARNARIRVMRRTLLIATCKNKTAQQRTIAIIVQYLGRVFYKYRQLTLVI